MRKLTTDDSSNVSHIAYDADASGGGFMEVKFRDGGLYRYRNCSLDDFATACHAPSIGKWVQAALVRQPKDHPYERVAELVADPTHVSDPSTRTTLQLVLAAVSPPRIESVTPAGAVALLTAARNLVSSTLGGQQIPPLPADIPAPTPTVVGVEWYAAEAIRARGGELTRDEAVAVAASLVHAAFGAAS